jgi:hypothetical protein
MISENIKEKIERLLKKKIVLLHLEVELSQNFGNNLIFRLTLLLLKTRVTFLTRKIGKLINTLES